MKWMFVATAVLGVLAAGAAAAWWWMGQAMYAPGDALALVLETPPQQAGTGRWDVGGGVTLAVQRVGGEGPAWVAVHGGPGQAPAQPWAVAQHMASRQPWLFYHQRGCGNSTRPFNGALQGSTYQRMQQVEAALGLAQQVADLERIRRISGQARVVLVGHSFGTLLATLYAAEFPEHTAALVLLAPANLVRMPNPDGDLFAMVRTRLPADQLAEYDAYTRRVFDFPALLDMDEAQLAQVWGGLVPFFAAATHQALPSESPLLSGGFMPLAVYLSLGRHHDWSAAMGRVQAPVLVVHGDQDLVPLEQSRRFSAWFPHAQLKVLPDAGHFMQEQAPEALANMIGKFVAEAEE